MTDKRELTKADADRIEKVLREIPDLEITYEAGGREPHYSRTSVRLILTAECLRWYEEKEAFEVYSKKQNDIINSHEARIAQLEEALRQIHAWTAFNASPSAEQISEMRKTIDSLLNEKKP